MSNFNIELCKQSLSQFKQKSETLKASEFLYYMTLALAISLHLLLI